MSIICEMHFRKVSLVRGALVSQRTRPDRLRSLTLAENAWGIWAMPRYRKAKSTIGKPLKFPLRWTVPIFLFVTLPRVTGLRLWQRCKRTRFAVNAWGIWAMASYGKTQDTVGKLLKFPLRWLLQIFLFALLPRVSRPRLRPS